MADQILERGELQFSTDSRILRELGERLVRRPETALIELVKNAYDADASECSVAFEANDELCVRDNGVGMTLEQFSSAWMRIGTASKTSVSHSPEYGREITGEKGIGRFSVRFLGEQLQLETVAHDPTRSRLTKMTADFDWPAYDRSEDLGKVPVPFRLEGVPEGTQTGTTLRIRRLRHVARSIDARQVRTASIGLLSPLRSLMVKSRPTDAGSADPGFRLNLAFGPDGDTDDVAGLVLDAYTMRARLRIRRRRLTLQVWAAGRRGPTLELTNRVRGLCGDVDADIRFFPRREGAFRDLGVDGRIAYTWVKENSGVAVFDRSFRVSPYGESGDDWLRLSADAARNERRPRSSLARNHFAMSEAELTSTSDNWMLRLPLSTQLVGVVQVAGVRSSATADPKGLVAAADREGFVANEAFAELQDHVRGAVEAIAVLDRRLQREQDERLRQQRLARLQEQAASAVREIEANPNLPVAQRKRLVSAVTAMATEATAHEEATRERVRQLEVMSLLGVVAGFMTHEFGVALDELDTAHRLLEQAMDSGALSGFDLSRLEAARSRLSDFTDYSTAYISGSRHAPKNSYTALPRVRLIHKTFSGYADERGVHIDIDINRGLEAPRVPTSLYDGIVLNLLTNALKAVTTEGASEEQPTISIRAWREKEEHMLEVADNGIGIPPVLRERVFDPLFTTTATKQSPLGSGMGLGLALVRASTEAFGGKVNVIDPPGGYSTCIQVRLPMRGPEDD